MKAYHDARAGAFAGLPAVQAACRACRACAEAGFQVESLPVFEGRPGQRAYLLGQAPGIVEGGERRPWRGRAGKQLRRWLDLDEDAFYAAFYCSSVTRCYPGRLPGGRGDRAPSPPERVLCARWREEELRLLRPRLVVPVGGLAIQALLRPSLGAAAARLADVIGEAFPLDRAVAVPLPHPSGASSWPHQPGNRERLDRALAAIRQELTALGGARG